MVIKVRGISIAMSLKVPLVTFSKGRATVILADLRENTQAINKLQGLVATKKEWA